MKSLVLKGKISEVIEDIKDKRWKQDICYIGHLKKEIALLKQENEDNLKCIKSLKEQLESVIKNNQELLEKWHKNNDKIVNLISENERLKELNIKVNDKYLELFDDPDVKVIADNKPVLIYEKGELVGLILPIKEY